MRSKRKSEGGPYVTEIRLDRGRVPSFGSYPFSLPIVREFESLDLHPSVTFLIGSNGSGKSTLLEAIAAAWGLNPEGGSRNFNFVTRSSHSKLDDYLTLVKTSNRPKDGYFLRAESFYNVATEIENRNEDGGLMGSYGGTSLHEMSHGESFLALVANRFFGGLYILDEPEAALSPDGVLSLIARIHQLVEEGSQFIIATHSPILISYPRADVYEILDGKLVKTPFQETRHYLLTRDLLNRPHVIEREIMRKGSREE